MDPQNTSAAEISRVDRKTIEKNRRIYMKALYSKLNSLVPIDSSKEAVVSLPEHLEEAANYIKKLQIKLERMKQKKDSFLKGIMDQSSPDIANLNFRTTMEPAELKSVQIEVHEMDTALAVVLITGLDFQFMFKETVQLLHEEGADIVNAGFSVHNDTIFHTIHSKVGEKYAPGYGASRISKRLKNFVYGCASYNDANLI